MGPYLEITTPQGKSQAQLGMQPLTVGRHADNKLVIQDHRASRFHCVIERKPGGWVVRDLNSSNGTLMHGSPITTAPLKPGDSIVIGQTRIKLIDPAAMPAKNGDEDELEVVDEGEDVEELSDEDVVEELDETDVVEVDEPPRRPSPPPARKKPAPAASSDRISMDVDPDPDAISFAGIEDDAPIPVDVPAPSEPAPAELEVGEFSDVNRYEEVLDTLADSLPEKPFAETDISLVSARGQIMHAAKEEIAARKGKKKREAVDLLRLVLTICARGKGSDIHLEPKTDFFMLRVRIDGLMVDVTRMPTPMGIKLSALVKVLSDIDISQRNAIQEGHFAAKIPGATGGTSTGFRRADYRVSFAPAVFGQKLVIRVFDAANAPLKVGDLQLPEWMANAIKRELQKEAGMLLVCGPTGSGKTTTLYALVRSSDVTRRNVVTIEDPVEVQIDGATQIPVDEPSGKSFSILLRSVLRQDPDAILVGEIRDTETARIAMQAAITGHLVFSTVHTTNTTGSIFRLLDLGVEPYLVAQGLHIVLAQRLVRQLCRFCKKPVKPTENELEMLAPVAKDVQQIYVAKGCPKCLGTGFMGRRAFFEMLQTTDKLRDVITTTRTLEDVRKALATTKFVPLEHSGYQLVAEGVTSMEEIEMAVGQ
jgi:type II secretory ATPase GspE/PulE/Tfp pilus assembly ATPase PilB-like protein/pSer/pThr/pTyr-binding forkhead associated (FHA) protein